jgi:hypothetical protein
MAGSADSRFLFAHLMSLSAHSLRAAVHCAGDGAVERRSPILALRQDRIEIRRFRLLYGLRMTTPFVIGFEPLLDSATAWEITRRCGIFRAAVGNHNRIFAPQPALRSMAQALPLLLHGAGA